MNQWQVADCKSHVDRDIDTIMVLISAVLSFIINFNGDTMSSKSFCLINKPGAFNVSQCSVSSALW